MNDTIGAAAVTIELICVLIELLMAYAAFMEYCETGSGLMRFVTALAVSSVGLALGLAWKIYKED